MPDRQSPETRMKQIKSFIGKPVTPRTIERNQQLFTPIIRFVDRAFTDGNSLLNIEEVRMMQESDEKPFVPKNGKTFEEVKREQEQQDQMNMIRLILNDPTLKGDDRGKAWGRITELVFADMLEYYFKRIDPSITVRKTPRVLDDSYGDGRENRGGDIAVMKDKKIIFLIDTKSFPMAHATPKSQVGINTTVNAPVLVVHLGDLYITYAENFDWILGKPTVATPHNFKSYVQFMLFPLIRIGKYSAGGVNSPFPTQYENDWGIGTINQESVDEAMVNIFNILNPSMLDLARSIDVTRQNVDFSTFFDNCYAYVEMQKAALQFNPHHRRSD